MPPTPLPIWTPRDVSSTRIDGFRARVAAKYGLHLPDYWRFWQWSSGSGGGGGERGQKGQAGVSSTDPLYPPPTWFPDASLNFAENLLRNGRHPAYAQRTAVVSAYEARQDDATHLDFATTSLTHAQLYAAVAQAVAALRSLGVQQGHVIAAYSANDIPALVLLLATTAIGAIWCSVAADAAPDAVLDRFETVRPTWVLAVEEVRYNGKVWPHRDKLRQVLRSLEQSRTDGQQHAVGGAEGQRHAVEGVIIAPGPSGVHTQPFEQEQDAATPWRSPRHLAWDDFLQLGAHARDDAIPFTHTDFNAPLWILFSSGTTGKPKAIVHRAGGMLLQLAKEHLLHSGLDASDVLLQYSTLSWMMYPWAVGALLAGATLVLYDGSPLRPHPLALFRLARQLGITVFGTSAAYIEALMRAGVVPKDGDGQEPLRIRQILSTGSSLGAEAYHWIREKVSPHVLTGSITGGTDICSLFAGNNVALPVYPGEIQCPNLGMHVAIVRGGPSATGQDGQGALDLVPFPPLAADDAHAHAHADDPDVGEGELTCLAPFPAQPLSFWAQSAERYRASYYESYGPRVWAHGDWCAFTQRGGLLIKGRSDGVLNPGGVRFGSAEIYEVINHLAHTAGHPYSAIQASVALGLRTPSDADEVVVLCLVLSDSEAEPSPPSSRSASSPGPGRGPSPRSAADALLARLAPLLRSSLRAARAVPLTVNGKLAEVPAKRVMNYREREQGQGGARGGWREKVNTSTLVDGGACLEEYRVLGERLRAELRAGEA